MTVVLFTTTIIVAIIVAVAIATATVELGYRSHAGRDLDRTLRKY